MFDTHDIEVRNGRLWLQWPDVYPYDIELHRIRDKYDLAQWVVHLADKNWMCPCRLIQFLTAAARAKGWVSNSMHPAPSSPICTASATMRQLRFETNATAAGHREVIAVTAADLPLWSDILLHLGAEALRPDAPDTEWTAAAASFFGILRTKNAEMTIVAHKPVKGPAQPPAHL